MLVAGYYHACLPTLIEESAMQQAEPASAQPLGTLSWTDVV